MRTAPAGVAVVLLASCTLIVPIDDDVSARQPDAAIAGDSGPNEKEAGPSPDGGALDAASDARVGCPGPPDDPDLIGWWPLDEKEGTVAHDCSPSLVDLKPLGIAAPAWAQGMLAGGAELDGVGTCWTADDPTVFRFDSGEPFTVVAWVFVREFDQADETGRWVASHKVSPNGWHFGADDPDRLEIDFEYVVDGGNKKTQVSGSTTANVWHHFAASYSPGDATTYIDGVVKQTVTGSSVPASFKAAMPGAFHIGCRGAKSNVFKGTIDDVRIYKRVLDAGEITKLAARR